MDPLFEADCPLCNGTGILCSAPEGETIYCEDCCTGVQHALSVLGVHLELDAAWLGRAAGWLGEEGLVCAQAIYSAELAEWDRLSALLDSLERDETNRCSGRLFEDAHGCL